MQRPPLAPAEPEPPDEIDRLLAERLAGDWMAAEFRGVVDELGKRWG
jgi:hypothetical protein